MADRYDRDRYDRERGYGRDDRGMLDRAGDEVRSWLGDDEAARRRERDERESYRAGEYGRERGREYGRPYGSSGEQRPPSGGQGESWRESDRGREDWRPRQDWNMSASRPARLESETRYGGGYGGGYSGDYERGTYGRSFDRGFERDRGSSGSAYGDRNDPSYRRPYYQDIGSAASDYGYAGSYGGWTEGRGQFTGRGPKGYQRSDDRIREDVCDRLADDPHIDASDIEITVRNGEVTLAGSVRDRKDKRHAEDVAEHVSGVREVNNSLRVNRGQNNPGDVIGLNTSPAQGSAQPGTGSTNKR